MSIRPDFEIREVVASTGEFINSSCGSDSANGCEGARCGSVFIDHEFKICLRRKLGNERFQRSQRNGSTLEAD
jgi:hypothetical protein